MYRHAAVAGMGLLVSIGLVGCGGGGAPTNGGGGDDETPGNHDPEIQSLASGAEKLWPGDGTTVTCSASDGDADTLTYTWSADEGSFTDEGATVTWSGTGVSGTSEIRCEVTDGRGGSATGAVSVAVGMATVEGKGLVSPRGPQTSGGQDVLPSAAFASPRVSKYAASSTPLHCTTRSTAQQAAITHRPTPATHCSRLAPRVPVSGPSPS